MERDGWACVNCGSSTETLNVDHKCYVRGRDPWEYDDSELQTLCQPCHSAVTDWRERLALASAHTDISEQQLLGYVHGCALRKGRFRCLTFKDNPSVAYVQGLGDAYGIGGPWLSQELRSVRRLTDADMIRMRHIVFDSTEAREGIKDIIELLAKRFTSWTV